MTRQLPDEVLYRHCVSECPRDWFRACFIIWHSVAALRMVVSCPAGGQNDGAYPPLRGRMRSAYAVKEFLGEREDLLPPIVNRILAVSVLLPELVADPKFSPFVQCDADNGIVMSETLVEAFSEAPFVPGTLMFDVDAVYSRTLEIEGARSHATS